MSDTSELDIALGATWQRYGRHPLALASING
jgi:hypothetical protein